MKQNVSVKRKSKFSVSAQKSLMSVMAVAILAIFMLCEIRFIQNINKSKHLESISYDILSEELSIITPMFLYIGGLVSWWRSRQNLDQNVKDNSFLYFSFAVFFGFLALIQFGKF